jgi:hypothetical protein
VISHRERGKDLLRFLGSVARAHKGRVPRPDNLVGTAAASGGARGEGLPSPRDGHFGGPSASGHIGDTGGQRADLVGVDAVKGGSPDRLRNTVSEAQSLTQIGHLIPVISLVARGGTTCKNGSEHCAGALLLRSQMLYPLSYERWVTGAL